MTPGLGPTSYHFRVEVVLNAGDPPEGEFVGSPDDIVHVADRLLVAIDVAPDRAQGFALSLALGWNDGIDLQDHLDHGTAPRRGLCLRVGARAMPAPPMRRARCWREASTPHPWDHKTRIGACLPGRERSRSKYRAPQLRAATRSGRLRARRHELVEELHSIHSADWRERLVTDDTKDSIRELRKRRQAVQEEMGGAAKVAAMRA